MGIGTSEQVVDAKETGIKAGLANLFGSSRTVGAAAHQEICINAWK